MFNRDITLEEVIEVRGRKERKKGTLRERSWFIMNLACQ